MALQARIQPLRQDIELLLAELSSPQERSIALVEFARDKIADAKTTNRQALGREPPSKIFVDGRQTDALESVRPGGTIVCDFQLIGVVLFWIGGQLELHSPFKTGRYKRSHQLFADGQQVSWENDDIPEDAQEYAFVNAVPYARKIERGSSTQTPEGVYQTVAVLARQRFGSVASITFALRTVTGGGIIGGKLANRSDRRNPAVIVRQRA